MLDNFILQPNDTKRALDSTFEELNHVQALVSRERRFERQLDFRIYLNFLQGIIMKLSAFPMVGKTNPVRTVKITRKSQAQNNVLIGLINRGSVSQAVQT